MTEEQIGKTVLVVDDDPDVREQFQAQLAALGHKVVCASGREEAERMFSEVDPDLAIVDLMMEEPDAGFVLCHHLRQQRENLPILVVTGVAGETGIEFGNEGGGMCSWCKADAVLSKPVRFEQLKREIDMLFGRR